MQRVVKTVEPFEFRSDFQPASTEVRPVVVEEEESPEEQIKLTGPELAELLSMARSEGISEALQLRSDEMREDLSGISSDLTRALGSLVTLAEHLEASGLEQGAGQKTLDLINMATKRIVDGQGDLFSKIEHMDDDNESDLEEQA